MLSDSRRAITARLPPTGIVTFCPGAIADALAAIRRRGAKIIWLNPLKGWEGYAPTARGMAAALPHLSLVPAG